MVRHVPNILRPNSPNKWAVEILYVVFRTYCAWGVTTATCACHWRKRSWFVLARQRSTQLAETPIFFAARVKGCIHPVLFLDGHESSGFSMGFLYHPIASYSHGGNGMMVACAGIWDDLQCGGLRQEWRGDRILHSMRQGGHCLSVWKEHHQLPWSKWRALSGGFQSMGVSLNHPFIDGISIINHPFWGTICGSPPPKKLWITLRRV